MPTSRPEVWDIITLSVKQSFQRMAFWILPNLWAVLLSIPIVTWPAAKAALYKTVVDGLRDPSGIRIKPRQVFRQAFFQHLSKSILLTFFNLLVLVTILITIYFWIGQGQRLLNYVAIIALYFFMMWWMCQPFLFPVLVENPSLSLPQLIRQVIILVSRQPLNAFLVTLTTTLITLLGLVLLGPILLLIPSLAALISIQAYWAMVGEEIPDFIDPVEYENRQRRL
ncbi:MAG: hypothetical protein MUO64_10880 [Anaerolineales bacterium]|nr:hypothetical protein [Anaerolineales bacterium]